MAKTATKTTQTKKPQSTAKPKPSSSTAPTAPENGSLPAVTKAALPTGDKIAAHVRGIVGLLPDLQRDLDAAYKSGSITLARAFVVMHRLNEIMFSDEKSPFKPLKQEFAKLKTERVPGLFEQEGIDNVPLSEGFTVGTSTTKYASIKPGHKEAAYAWLREKDKGDLIQETINSSTLSAFARELAEQNFDLPEDIFNVADVNNTSVRKNK